MIKWRPPAYEGDRRVAVAGIVEIGAVFPPDSDGKWRWRMWLTSSVLAKEGKASTELAAKTDLDRAWASFLMCANLAEAA
jgi:hypothetical protein